MVVLANELLDNLPFRILHRGERRWQEVRVGIDGEEVRLAEVLVPAEDDQVRAVGALAPDAPAGARVPVQARRDAGCARAAPRGARRPGRVLRLRGAHRRPGGPPVDGWLRTYAGHDRGGPLLDRLGQQDITTEVCVDQLARVRAPAGEVRQADWLAEHGIDELVDEGRRVWSDRAAVADLEALRARSRVSEAEALLDPTGLGAFRVLEWTREP